MADGKDRDLKGHQGAEGGPDSPPPPPPRPRDEVDDPGKFGPGADFLGKMAEQMLSIFCELAGQQMRSTGGRATSAELREMAARFGGSAGPLGAYFRKATEDWYVAYKRGVYLSRRKHALHRLLVHEFAELFKAENEGKDDPDALKRDNLPMFFIAIRLIVGEEGIAEFEAKCLQILDDLKAKLGEQSSWSNLWELFYADPRAATIKLRALYMMAAYFRRWDIRRQWFIQVMNHDPSSIGVASNVYVQFENRSLMAGGKFTEAKFTLLMRELFKTLNPDKITNDHKKMLRDEFGPEFVPVISNLYFNLSGARNR